MAEYTVRIELHNAAQRDYDSPHRYMAVARFSRVVRDDKGQDYQLPLGEFSWSGILSAHGVQAFAKAAAARTGKEFSVIVTEAKSRVWLLPRAAVSPAKPPWPTGSTVKAGYLRSMLGLPKYVSYRNKKDYPP